MAQQIVVQAFNRALDARNAPTVIRKALFASGIVESGLTNVKGGDADSTGALQQRKSQGWTGLNSPQHAAAEFISHAEQVLKSNPTITSAALAQAVQRSAYPGRYGSPKVQSAAQRYATGKGSNPAPRTMARAASTSPGTTGTVTPAHEVPDSGAAAEMALLAGTKMMDKHLPKIGTGVLADAAHILDSGKATRTVGTKYTPGQEPKVTLGTAPAGAVSRKGGGKSGTVNFEGKQVAAWIAPALQYARGHGWTGKVQSGYRSFADQTRIYNSGVRPAAKPGTSNHEGSAFPRGAVDASQAEQLATILKSSPYASKLVWAGGKDPVHFSHPHGGSY